MFFSFACLLLLAAASVSGQQAGSVTAETHPRLTWQQCTGASCTPVNGEIVLDANWRWTRVDDGGYTNCFTGEDWNAAACPDDVACAQNCAVEGADYSGTYGITTTGDSLTLKLVTGSNIGSRNYLLQDENTYQIFSLLNKEFTFDVDVSKLPCGVNGALYFVEMEKTGDLGKGANNAGAKFGTGYCDAQCPHDLKFIDGEANSEGWQADAGTYGTCCNEMDIWEANSYGSAYTAHTCNVPGGGAYRCSGIECEASGGVCDKSGCDYSHYRLGEPSYYGPGGTVDTNAKITVVTQFIGSPLEEIRRFYVQNGRRIENSVVNITGVKNYDSITPDFCVDSKVAFQDENTFDEEGGFSSFSQSLQRGHVLVLSVWVDYAVNMLWLDSSYPQDADPNQPGVTRGDCPASSGVPEDVISQFPDAQVVFSNIRFGDIGSTTN